MPRLAELNREIKEAEARLVELDHAIKPSAAADFDGAAMDRHAEVSRELDDLFRRKAAIDAGEPDPKPAPVIKKPLIVRSRPAEIEDEGQGRINDLAALIRKSTRAFIEKAKPKSWITTMAQVIATIVERQREERVKLEQRIASLEARQKDFRHRGTWSAALYYNENNFVTDGGSMWICKRYTQKRPGTCDDWSLVAKRGRAGKDADGVRR